MDKKDLDENKSKNEKISDILGHVVFLSFIWFFLSVVTSLFQAMAIDEEEGFTCETTMYIEYVIFTDLFCEIKKENDNE